MRLDLREIIQVPGGNVPFSFALDLSGLDFYGAKPIAHPILVEGQVRNRAGVLELSGKASTVLELACDRCGQPFRREKTVPLDTLLATELAGEDHGDIVLLDGTELDLDELATSAFVLAMDSKNLCQEDCKGLCPGCGVDLNHAPCRCRREMDPRLAALAQLLDKE
ncbi:MAG: DUF177 domain-containing protein [Clostridiales bacterium]|nr:DUF177 domain-containing protein [Clostridiales bacterium]